MKYAASLTIAAAFAVGSFLCVSGAALANPITIQQCFVTVPKALSKTASGTQIVYVNNGPKTAQSVTFVVGYRNAAQHFIRRITDYGTFTPGTAINHHFDLYNDVTYAGKQTQSCYPVSVKWADGTTWTYGY